jgi:hypothetical protein
VRSEQTYLEAFEVLKYTKSLVVVVVVVTGRSRANTQQGPSSRIQGRRYRPSNLRMEFENREM